jgi:hypothetical protein
MSLPTLSNIKREWYVCVLNTCFSIAYFGLENNYSKILFNLFINNPCFFIYSPRHALHHMSNKESKQAT